MTITPERLAEWRAAAESGLPYATFNAATTLTLLDLLAEKDAEIERLDATIFNFGHRADKAKTERDAAIAEVEAARIAGRNEAVSGINWNTTCLNCATLLDRCYGAEMQRDSLRACLSAVEEIPYHEDDAGHLVIYYDELRAELAEGGAK